jgi:hypothetical protein
MTGILGYALVGGGFIALMGLGGAGLGGAGLGGGRLGLAVGMFGFWFTLAVSNGCYTMLIQVKVPHHLHGRVFALNQMVAFAAMPVGFALAGPLADGVFEPWLGPGRGIALLMVVLGELTVLANLAGFGHPRLRRLDTDLPDAHPDEAINRKR